MNDDQKDLIAWGIVLPACILGFLAISYITVHGVPGL